jgi:CheY-like chemotaxis protein/nitrogen-specific signal transduction histidine kinase
MNVELGADGRPAGFVKLMKDLTERRAFEEHLRTTNRLKDEFLATLAHELRNPLAPIRSALTVIARGGPLTESQQRAVGIAERQLQNMVRLVDDLLEVSRVTSGKLALQTQPTRLSDALDSALEMIRPGADAAGHVLDVDTPRDDLYVDGDPVRLAQVFGNLLANSVKYTPPGGRIRVAARPSGEGVELMVQDNGSGIDKDVLPTVFDLFAQADRPVERQTGGLGIGLALVKRLVEMHRGTVAADSRGVGQGSTFRVWLPTVPAPQAGPAGEEPRAGAQVARRVLVVDDNVDAADTLAALLLTEGHEVLEAHDGAQALARVLEFEPEVVFMDIGLPHLDGLEITRRIRALPLRRQPRIVALTGWNQEADRERSRRAGVDAHLAKPADADAIARALAGLH